MIIATAQKITTASPDRIFQIWANVERWKDWDDSVKWAAIDGNFTNGSKIRMKPRGGPKTTALLTLVEQDHAFNDISRLPGAIAYFNHTVATAEGNTVVTHTVGIEGPMGWLWTRIMGHALQESLQPAVDKLVTLAEQSHEPAQ